MRLTTHPVACWRSVFLLAAVGLLSWEGAGVAWAQSRQSAVPPAPRRPVETPEGRDQRLPELVRPAVPVLPSTTPEYRIGPDDLLDVTVFEAPELDRTVRVSAGGEISMSLLGAVQAAGLTPRELEVVLQELLRRTYMKDPHVGVYVQEMQSHPVSVFGAVEKPGVYQIRGTKTLVEVLSMAEGLSEDAGDTVIVMRGGSFRGVTDQDEKAGQEQAPLLPPPEEPSEPEAPSASLGETTAGETIQIDLKELLESGDPRHNVRIYPGDIVKVTRAGIIYVVGEVKKPGGFVLKSNENISVLQAIALGEGLTRTAAKSRSLIVRTNEQQGGRTEIPIDLGKILAGKSPDPLLRPKDIVFVPNSTARSALYRGAETALSIVSGVIIWRR